MGNSLCAHVTVCCDRASSLHIDCDGDGAASYRYHDRDGLAYATEVLVLLFSNGHVCGGSRFLLT